MQTPSQTVGPFFHIGLASRSTENILVTAQTTGQHIVIQGRVVDGESEAVPDALIEIWQADASGVYNHPDDPGQSEADPHFRYFGRADTRNAGQFTFTTVKPGAVPYAEATLQAPHINMRVFARGMLIQAYTRLYFSDESEANAADPVLTQIDPGRRETLIAQLQPSAGLPDYHFDIRLQGQNETVFFDPC